MNKLNVTAVKKIKVYLQWLVEYKIYEMHISYKFDAQFTKMSISTIGSDIWVCEFVLKWISFIGGCWQVQAILGNVIFLQKIYYAY